jgi:hypothetical protein
LENTVAHLNKDNITERELTYIERYDIWFKNNYETGMEKNYDIVPDFDNPYYVPTPTKISIK